MTRSLQTIVESAIVSTITMPVAADRPPMKTSSASASLLLAPSAASARRCRRRTPPPEKCSSPPNAIGSTKMLIASR